MWTAQAAVSQQLLWATSGLLSARLCGDLFLVLHFSLCLGQLLEELGKVLPCAVLPATMDLPLASLRCLLPS